MTRIRAGIASPQKFWIFLRIFSFFKSKVCWVIIGTILKDALKANRSKKPIGQKGRLVEKPDWSKKTIFRLNFVSSDPWSKF